MNWEIYFIQGMELLFLGIAAYQDLKFREISIKLFLVFGFLAIIFNLFWRYQSIECVLTGVVLGSGFLLVSRLTKEAIGYGDSLGMIVLGIFAGGELLLHIVFVSGIFSGVYGLWMLLWLKSSARDTLPFFPFLFLGAMGGMFL